MAAKGYITEKKGESDGRKNFILLSPAGEQTRQKMQAQLDDVTTAIEKAMEKLTTISGKPSAEWEFPPWGKKPPAPVLEEKKTRESSEVQIVRLYSGRPVGLPAAE